MASFKTRAGVKAEKAEPQPRKAKGKGKGKEEIEEKARREAVTKKGDAFFATAGKDVEENRAAIDEEKKRLARSLDSDTPPLPRGLGLALAQQKSQIFSLEQMHDLLDDERLLRPDSVPVFGSPARPMQRKGKGKQVLEVQDANTGPEPTRLDRVKDSLRKPGQPVRPRANNTKTMTNDGKSARARGLEGVKATLKRNRSSVDGSGSPEKPVIIDDDNDTDGMSGDPAQEVNVGDRPGIIPDGDDAPGETQAVCPYLPPPSSPQGPSAGAEFFAMMQRTEEIKAMEEAQLAANPCPPSSAEKRVTLALEKTRREIRELDDLEVPDPSHWITVAERAQLDRLLDEDDRCPICGSALPLVSSSEEYLKQYHRITNRRLFPNLSSEVKLQFCALHEAESRWIPLGQIRGYPKTIDWQALLQQLDDSWITGKLQEVADDPMTSPLYVSHAEYVEEHGRDAWIQAVRKGAMGDPAPGYFGIIGRNLLETYFKALDNDGTLRIDLIPSGFMTRDDLLQLVLVPEAATLLIMANPPGGGGWSPQDNNETYQDAYERANVIRQQSILYGQSKFDGADEMAQALVVLKRHRTVAPQAAASARAVKHKRTSPSHQSKSEPEPNSKPKSSSKRKNRAMTSSSVVDLTLDVDVEPSSSASSIGRDSNVESTPKKSKTRRKEGGKKDKDKDKTIKRTRARGFTPVPSPSPSVVVDLASPPTASYASPHPKRSKKRRRESPRNEFESSSPTPTPSRVPQPISQSQDLFSELGMDLTLGSQELDALDRIELLHAAAAATPRTESDSFTSKQAKPCRKAKAAQSQSASQGTQGTQYSDVFDYDAPGMEVVNRLVDGKA